ncbi:hypothetical protein B0J12DRAFT_688755 [Macrophomina phaseolina]|uniref:JmjC domain-containing protein n=1 Tax=Macrophomina phaseolina TaxID=35725 RepID=A0ABQ8FUA5_9PEZI|nr:hypothetical protein B0J12DRAFT_688755 [Macrophomina phaseolina]
MVTTSRSCRYPGCSSVGTTQHEKREHFFCCGKSFVQTSAAEHVRSGHNLRKFVQMDFANRRRHIPYSFRFEDDSRDYTIQDLEGMTADVVQNSNNAIRESPQQRQIRKTATFQTAPLAAPDRLAQILDRHGISRDHIPFLDAFFHPSNEFLDDAGDEKMMLFGSKHEQPYISQQKHWNRNLNLDEVAISVLADFMASPTKEICQDEQPLSGAQVFKAIAQLMILIRLPNPETKSYVMNQPTPSLEEFRHIPPAALQPYRKLTEPSDLSANVTPTNLCIDLHHDLSLGFNTLFGPPKLWILYPPNPHNLSVLGACYGTTNRLIHCFRELNNGILVEQKHGETLVLPPYILHATFTVQTNILLGWELEVVEFFPKRLTHLPFDVNHRRAELSTPQERDSFVISVLEHLQSALETSTAQGLDELVNAWVAQKPKVLPLLEGRTWNEAVTRWKNGWSAKRHSVNIVRVCPLCSVQDILDADLASHLASHQESHYRGQENDQRSKRRKVGGR